MLSRIIRKEIVSHILSLRFGVTFVLFIVLVFASIFVSVREHERSVAEHNAQVRVGLKQMEDIKREEDPRQRMRRTLFDGRIDPLPVADLSWLGQGLQAGYPLAFKTMPYGSSNVERGLTRNPILGLLRVPDFVYVVNVVLSLLAILFMFDAVCGEKESGTLKLVLTNSVPRHSVLLGKWLGGYVVLIAPFLVAAGAGIGYAWVRGAFEPTQENLLRIVFIVLLACLYIAAFFSLSLFISTVTHRSPTALLLSMVVWVVFILVIPNMAPVTAKILRPTPPARVIASEMRAIDDEYALKQQRLTMTGAVSYGQTVQQAADELAKEQERDKRQWQLYFDKLETSQYSLAGTLARLSPSALWTFAAVTLANTGPLSYDRLEAARTRLSKELEGIADDFYRRWRADPNREMPEFSVDQVPALRATLPTLAEATNGALNDVLILVILNVIFFMLAFSFFLRYIVT